MTANSKFYGLIPAGGVGSRFGGPVPKQYAKLGGKTLLQWSTEALLAEPRVETVFVVVSEDDDIASTLFEGNGRVQVLAKGGHIRAKTVLNGLNHLLSNMLVSETDWVLVHDAARPGLQSADLSRLIDEASTHIVGGLLALPVPDTLKKAEKSEEGEIIVKATVPREGVWAAQTPQMFRAQALSLALAECEYKQAIVTDEASAIEIMGMSPQIVRGSLSNLKVTEANDLVTVGRLLGATPGE